MTFVLVNGRTPRPQSLCAWCCEPIGESYLRELTTHLSYCDHDCYVGHCKATDQVLRGHVSTHRARVSCDRGASSKSAISVADVSAW
jgi:hypothetical protein